MSRKKKTIISGLVAVVVIVVGITTYVQGKHYVTRKEVKEYLTGSEGYAESDIVELESFMANLPGDRNWMVSVGLKGEQGLYSYYYDRGQDKVVLESHNQDE